ncbi:MAG: hypothetical protein B6I24_02555 [Bacteroidetes bacterium 4572_128]|nr:MAG: hypothetical protein B6I24_02555 [Bacteroidetes bacterium 4572_128]
MSKIIFTGILVLILNFSFSQNDSTIFFKGNVYDFKKNPISGVHIIMQNANQITISKKDGGFYFPVKINDTVLFSAVGFKIKEIMIPEFMKNNIFEKDIILNHDTVILEEVVILPWSSYEDAKQAFLSMKLPEKISPDLSIEMPLLSSNNGKVGVGIGLSVPLISMLYNKYSDRENSKRKLVQLLKSDNLREKKYNKKIVSKILSLKDKKLIKKFLYYCDLSDEFLENATEYEIIEQILICYESFEKNNFKKKN